MIRLRFIAMGVVCIMAAMGYILFFSNTSPSYPYRTGNVVTLKVDGRNAVVVGTSRDYLVVKFPYSDDEVKVYPAEILDFKK